MARRFKVVCKREEGEGKRLDHFLLIKIGAMGRKGQGGRGRGVRGKDITEKGRNGMEE